jgi:MFS family permease
LRSAACYNLTACSGSGAPRHPKRVAPASAAGGILFGVIADRWGRTRALSLSILIYSVFTAACGFACNVTELAIYRVFLGIGFGGEWASGAALVSETWPPEHRGKALGLMQSWWAIGYAAAAIVTALCCLGLAGVRSFSSAWYRRSSRSGFAAAFPNPKSGVAHASSYSASSAIGLAGNRAT